MANCFKTRLLFGWNWRDILHSGHLEGTREELCRQNELYSAQTHKELKTENELPEHFPRASVSLRQGNPSQRQQMTVHRSETRGCEKIQRTYISTKHVVCLPNVDSIEPNGWHSVNAVKDKEHLLFGPGEMENTQFSRDQTQKMFLFLMKQNMNLTIIV